MAGLVSLCLLLMMPKLIELPQHRPWNDEVELSGAILSSDGEVRLLMVRIPGQ